MRPSRAVVGRPSEEPSFAAARCNSWRILETAMTTGLPPVTFAPNTVRHKPEKDPGRASQVADLPRITKRIGGDLLVGNLDALGSFVQAYDKTVVAEIEQLAGKTRLCVRIAWSGVSTQIIQETLKHVWNIGCEPFANRGGWYGLAI